MHEHRPPRWYENHALAPLMVNVAALVVVLVLWVLYSLLILALGIVAVNIVLWLLEFVRRWREQRRVWEDN